MSNILSQYYQGITQRLRSEVDFISTLFQHQGLKGESNENVLRELITTFIPRKYGIGTGIVIDRDGNQSDQCDVVIYDVYHYPSLLSLTSVHIFPVDMVYATIEVKTTLDSGEAQRSLANIASVRKLNFIQDEFMMWKPGGVRLAAVNYKPIPPIGFVFGFGSEAKQFETFKNWFTPKEEATAVHFPTLVGCLDQGLVKFADISPQAGMIPEGIAIPLTVNENDILAVAEPAKSKMHNGFMYPVKQVKSDYVLIDQGRALLLFLLLLHEMLALKEINPTIRFTEHYLKRGLLAHISV